MKAVLLAAGLGRRLRPITDDKPKCLVEVNKRPLLAYWLDALVGCGITEVLINLHYHADKVRTFLKAQSHELLVRQIFEPRLVGTAGTIRENAQFFDQNSVLVAHADNLCLSNLSTFIEAHKSRPRQTVITMMTFTSQNPKECGIVELDFDDVVINFYEKVQNPPGTNANGAVYIFEPSVIEFILARNEVESDISNDVLPQYMGKIFAWPADGLHIDIGTPDNLRKANLYLTESHS